MVERLVLTTAERDEVARVVDQALDGDRAGVADLAEVATVLAQSLPRRLREFLSTVRSQEDEAAVVSGLAVDDLPPTPLSLRDPRPTRGEVRAEVTLLLCGSALAEPFGWATQQEGRIVHNVCPTPGMETSLTSSSSKAPLALHTEDVFHPCRGDYVSLLCLRNPDAVATTVAGVAPEELPEDVRAVLSEDRFRFFPDDSHISPGEAAVDERSFNVGSVTYGPAYRPYLRFDHDFMDSVEGDEEAAKAMGFMHDHLTAQVREIVLEPGDLVFVDNHRLVHGRNPFRARGDGEDRWLKRLNLIRDVRRIHAYKRDLTRIL